MPFVKIDTGAWVNPDHVVCVKSGSYTGERDVEVQMVGGHIYHMHGSTSLDEVVNRLTGTSTSPILKVEHPRFKPPLTPMEPAPDVSWLMDAKERIDMSLVREEEPPNG